MTIPFLDIKAATDELAPELEAAALRVIRSGWYVGGAEVTEFERAFADFTGAPYCVGVANGLDALTLSLRALGIGAGDGVLVPSNTFIASWLAITQVGAHPVPVEPDPLTHLITAEAVSQAVTPECRAVMPVHLYGQPCDMPAILQVATAHKLKVIEDAAQAHGAAWGGQRIGAHGDAVCWSFYPGKNLGAMGDGGAVTTKDDRLAARIRQLGNYGASEKYINPIVGVNSRLDTIQAAMLKVKIAHLNRWTEQRCARAAQYIEALSGLSGLTLPKVHEGAEPVWHLFVITLRDAELRQRVRTDLSTAEIGTLIHYPVPAHMQGAYTDLKIPADALPVARKLAERVLSLPIGPHLSTQDCARVIEVLRAALTEA